MAVFQSSIAAGGPYQVYSNVRALTVLGPSIGSTYNVDSRGINPLGSGSTLSFDPNAEGVYPTVGLTPGPNVPLFFQLDVMDDLSGAVNFGQGFATPQVQEGDIAPNLAAAGGTVGGTPILTRDTTVPGQLVIAKTTGGAFNVTSVGFTNANPALIIDTGLGAPPKAMGAQTLASPYNRIFGIIQIVTSAAFSTTGPQMNIAINGTNYIFNMPTSAAAGTFTYPFMWGDGVAPPNAAFILGGAPPSGANIIVPAQAGLTSVRIIAYEGF